MAGPLVLVGGAAAVAGGFYWWLKNRGGGASAAAAAPADGAPAAPTDAAAPVEGSTEIPKEGSPAPARPTLPAGMLVRRLGDNRSSKSQLTVVGAPNPSAAAAARHENEAARAQLLRDQSESLAVAKAAETARAFTQLATAREQVRAQALALMTAVDGALLNFEKAEVATRLALAQPGQQPSAYQQGSAYSQNGQPQSQPPYLQALPGLEDAAKQLDVVKAAANGAISALSAAVGRVDAEASRVGGLAREAGAAADGAVKAFRAQQQHLIEALVARGEAQRAADLATAGMADTKDRYTKAAQDAWKLADQAKAVKATAGRVMRAADPARAAVDQAKTEVARCYEVVRENRTTRGSRAKLHGLLGVAFPVASNTQWLTKARGMLNSAKTSLMQTSGALPSTVAGSQMGMSKQQNEGITRGLEGLGVYPRFHAIRAASSRVAPGAGRMAARGMERSPYGGDPEERNVRVGMGSDLADWYGPAALPVAGRDMPQGIGYYGDEGYASGSFRGLGALGEPVMIFETLATTITGLGGLGAGCLCGGAASGHCLCGSR